MQKIQLNGRLIDNDNYFEPNDSFYEVIRIKQGSTIYFEAHIERLNQSLKNAGYRDVIDMNFAKSELLTYIKRVGVKDQNIKISVYYTPNQNFALYYIPSVYPNHTVYCEGVKSKTVLFKRHTPNIKQLSEDMRQLRSRITLEEIFDFVLVDDQGFIHEGTKSNVFFLKGDTFYTAPIEGVLAGITRQRVIDILKKHFNVIEKARHISEIKHMDGAFFTGTSIDILPIARVNDNILPSFENKYIQSLMAHYQKSEAHYIANHILNI